MLILIGACIVITLTGIAGWALSAGASRAARHHSH